jgi:linoleoyl-CoA desaturase
LSNGRPGALRSFVTHEKHNAMKLHFAAGGSTTFGESLRTLGQRYCSRYNLISRARRLLWVKLGFYAALFCAAYTGLLLSQPTRWWEPAIWYILTGLSGMLLAFNAAHDAVHSTFSKSRTTNGMIFSITFNLQGLSGHLWRIRHLASHHVFPNVDGCDADIDDNPFMMLSPHQKRRPWHRYQHVYATVLYTIYTLHWLLVKDIIYLLKKDLANLRNQRHSAKAVLQIFGWKAFYFFYMLVVPVLLTDYPAWWIAAAFLIMHGFISLFFVLTLIISHLCEETAFPVADEKGALPHDYFYHQLAVSMDYHPRSHVANWIFGGFNAHAAHHLFPRLPHTCYPYLSKVISRHCRRYNYPYHALSMPRAVLSHYRYLRAVGQPPR